MLAPVLDSLAPEFHINISIHDLLIEVYFYKAILWCMSGFYDLKHLLDFSFEIGQRWLVLWVQAFGPPSLSFDYCL